MQLSRYYRPDNAWGSDNGLQKNFEPPRHAQRLLDWIVDIKRRNDVRGDLDELYQIILTRDGETTANRWYSWQVRRSSAET